MTDLITVEQLEARLNEEFAGLALAQAQGLIADASALVIHVAKTDFATTGAPGVIVALVAQMVRRALDNPGELTGENIGAYGWQAQQAGLTGGSALYLTRAERRLVREAAGRPAVIGISMDSGLLDPRTADTS